MMLFARCHLLGETPHLAARHSKQGGFSFRVLAISDSHLLTQVMSVPGKPGAQKASPICDGGMKDIVS